MPKTDQLMYSQSLLHAMTCAVIFAVGFGAVGCSDSTTAKKPDSKFEVAEEPGSISGLPTQTGDPQDPSKPWRSDETGINAITRMLGYAQMLVSRNTNVSPEQQIQDRQSLIEIADDLSKLDLNPDQKMAALQMKSQSLLSMLAEGDGSAKPPLMELINSYLDDPDPNFSRTAAFLDLSVVMNDYFADETADATQLQERFVQIASKYPEDPQVAQRLSALASRLLTQGRRSHGVSLLRKLKDVYANSDSPELASLPQILEDRITMTEALYDLVISEMMQTGETEQFQKTLAELAKHKGGRELYRETIKGARQLEQFGLYEEAKAINEQLLKTYADNDDPVIQQQLIRDVEKGNTRMALVGKPIKLTGQLQDGTQLDPSALKDKTLAILFWSAKFPMSVRAMQPLMLFYDRFKDQGFEVVTVSIDEDAKEASNIFQEQQPPWTSLFRNDESYDEMLDQLGIQMVPYLMLVDKEGNVVKIHASLRDLEPSLIELIGVKEELPQHLIYPDPEKFRGGDKDN